jgi:mono/diheme cytochrome c family protein
MNPETVKSSRDQQENPEPRAAVGHTPIWLIIGFALMIYWGQLYLDSQAGGFDARIHRPYISGRQLADINPPTGGFDPVKAKFLFETYCGVCHQTTGLGMPGQFPPLAGSEWVTTPGVARLIRIPLHGLQGPLQVKGQGWNHQMLPMGATMSDADLAAVVSYIRQAWGNKASLVTPEQVKAVRDKTADRTAAWTAEELLKIPETE